jgi:hypothetical protein
MCFTGINYYKLAVEKDRDSIFTTITTIWKPGFRNAIFRGIIATERCCFPLKVVQLFQIRLSASKAEKSNTSAKGCWESLWKFINFLPIPSEPFALVTPLRSGTTLIDHLRNRLNFDLDKHFITAWKSITKLVIFQSFVAKCCKMRII